MVILDATFLLLLLYPDVSPPLDGATNKPLEKCRERIDLLLESLSKGRIGVMVPTPVLSEVLVAAGDDKARVLAEIHSTYAFQVQPFDEMAAVEVAMLTDTDLQSGRKLTEVETKAKVKYDRQIIAIAKVNNVKTIYTDDGRLGTKAEANGLTVVRLSDLPLPPEPPQGKLPLDVSTSPGSGGW